MNRPDASQITDDQLAALHAERDHLRDKVQKLSADLLTAHDESAGLYATASGLTVNDHGGYCGACGRGDASPNLDAYTALAAERNRLANQLRLAHETRRAKEHQLDGIRRALCDVGAMNDNDPYSHADLDDVIRQVYGATKQLAEVDQRCDGYFATIQRVRDVFAFGEQAIATVGPDAGSVAALVLQRLRLAVDGLDGPEHCNRCHGNEDGPCHEPEHVNGPADDSCCPGCRTPAVVETAVPDAYERDADGASWRTTTRHDL